MINNQFFDDHLCVVVKKPNAICDFVFFRATSRPGATKKVHQGQVLT